LVQAGVPFSFSFFPSLEENWLFVYVADIYRLCSFLERNQPPPFILAMSLVSCPCTTKKMLRVALLSRASSVVYFPSSFSSLSSFFREFLSLTLLARKSRGAPLIPSSESQPTLGSFLPFFYPSGLNNSAIFPFFPQFN